MSGYDDDGFENYQEDTTDPGPSLLIATILFCILLLAVLPLLLSAADKCNRRRREARSGGSSTDSVPTQENQEGPDASGALTTLNLEVRAIYDLSVC
jgi:hypothetical protein